MYFNAQKKILLNNKNDSFDPTLSVEGAQIKVKTRNSRAVGGEAHLNPGDDVSYAKLSSFSSNLADTFSTPDVLVCLRPPDESVGWTAGMNAHCEDSTKK